MLSRLLAGPVCARSPLGLASILGQCSGSAALSSRTRSRCEAGQTVAAARFRTIQVGRALYPPEVPVAQALLRRTPYLRGSPSKANRQAMVWRCGGSRQWPTCKIGAAQKFAPYRFRPATKRHTATHKLAYEVML